MFMAQKEAVSTMRSSPAPSTVGEIKSAAPFGAAFSTFNLFSHLASSGRIRAEKWKAIWPKWASIAWFFNRFPPCTAELGATGSGHALSLAPIFSHHNDAVSTSRWVFCFGRDPSSLPVHQDSPDDFLPCRQIGIKTPCSIERREKVARKTHSYGLGVYRWPTHFFHFSPLTL